MVKITADQMRWFRWQRSGLVEPFTDVVAAASQLAGIQAQILSAAAVSLWNRIPELTDTQFENLLFAERALVKLWGQRGTLHLYPSQEWPLIQAAFDDKKTWWHRNAERYGLDEAKFHVIVGQIVEILCEKGEIGRSDLRTADLAIADELLSSWGGLFQELVYRGHACHAGRRGNEGLFAHRQQWLPDLTWQPPPLLYRFDPLLLAHKDKSCWLDMKFYKRVWRPAGHIEGTVLDRGRIVGTWRYARQGSGLVVTVTPFGRLRRGLRGAIRQRAKGIAAFFEQPLSDLRYETAV